MLKSIFNKVAGFEEHLWTAASALPPASCSYFSECSLRLQVIRTTNLSTTERCVCNACNFMITGNPFLSILHNFSELFFYRIPNGCFLPSLFFVPKEHQSKIKPSGARGTIPTPLLKVSTHVTRFESFLLFFEIVVCFYIQTKKQPAFAVLGNGSS